VHTNFFYGAKHCYDNHIFDDIGQVFKDALCFRRFSMFRFLLIFPLARSVIDHFRHGFQTVLAKQDRRMMQLLWSLAEPFSRDGDFQTECLLVAVASRKLEWSTLSGMRSGSSGSHC
jgi:hypothetical protein